RHTRSKRDWSSDVCSSDLIIITVCKIYEGLRSKYSVIITVRRIYEGLRSKYSVIITVCRIYEGLRSKYSVIITVRRIYVSLRSRSEERRVGKECRGGWEMV